MSLLLPRKTYKPFAYPWAHDAFLTQNEIHWLPSEIDLGFDKVDWEENLSVSEKELLTNILRYFTQSDIDVNEGYLTKYMRIFQPVEVRMMMSAFANMEAIHIHAYANLIDTIGMPETFFSEFLEYKEMAAKHDYLEKFSVDTKEDIAKTLAMYSAFTEGLQLFASFAILFNFHRPEGGGRMRGMGKIVEWSIRDESLHVESMARLFKEFMHENPEIDADSVKKDIFEACYTTVKLEDAFTDLCFGVAGEIKGLKKEEIKRYVRYVANLRMKQLGLLAAFPDVVENPLIWMEELLMPRHTNFFENRVTEYSKGSTKGNWSDLEF